MKRLVKKQNVFPAVRIRSSWILTSPSQGRAPEGPLDPVIAYFCHSPMAVRSLKLLGGGGVVRGSEGHPAADEDLASEKGPLLAKRALFSSITWGELPPASPARYGPESYSTNITRIAQSEHNVSPIARGGKLDWNICGFK